MKWKTNGSKAEWGVGIVFFCEVGRRGVADKAQMCCVRREWRGAYWKREQEMCLGGVSRWIWEWMAFENRDVCVMIFLG